MYFVIFEVQLLKKTKILFLMLLNFFSLHEETEMQNYFFINCCKVLASYIMKQTNVNQNADQTNKSPCINILFHKMKLKTAQDWGPVDSVWNSRGVDGATIPLTLEKDNVWKDHQEARWSPLAWTLMKWCSIPAFVQKRKTMSGLSSSVQVRSLSIHSYLWYKRCFSV